MNVVAITHRTPFPPDKGDKIRTFHLLSRLARRASVHLFAFAEPPDDIVHRATLLQHFASVTLVPLDMRLQKLRAVPYLATLCPMTLPEFHNPRLKRAVSDAVHGIRPDVIFAASTSMAPYALAHPHIPTMMDFVDVDSAKWRAYADRATGPARMVYLREAWTLARYERYVARHAAISAVTADREKVLLDAIAPGSDVRTLPNGVDTEYYTPRPADAVMPPSAVFFGAMDYYANVDAAVFLVREVLPRLRARYRNFRIVIAGSKPAREAMSLAAVPGVTVTGYVSDIRPHVQGASVCVIPLRVARGVQNKVLEAMAMGVPVIASPAAAEGIAATQGEDFVIAPTEAGGRAMAEAILDLVADPVRGQAMADSARRRVEETYGWDPRARELLSMLDEARRNHSR